MYNKKLCHKFGLQAEKGKLAIHLNTWHFVQQTISSADALP